MKKERQNVDIISMYFDSIKNIEALKYDEEIRLIKLAQAGDINARNRVVNANLKFVVKSAKKYSNPRISILDLIEEGNIGLIEAVSHFDTESNNKFSTYAVWWINQSIIKYFQDKSRLIRIPVNRSNELIKINKMIEEYNDKNILVDYDEIASELNLDRNAVLNIINISCPISSLDKTVNNDEDNNGSKASINDFIASTLPTAVDLLEDEANKEYIESLLNEMPKRERDVLKLRYGFNKFGEMGLEDIGQIYNLTKERIRQIESKALDILREKLAI